MFKSKFFIAKSPIHGRGMFTKVPFKKGHFICRFINKYFLKFSNHSRAPNASLAKFKGKLIAYALRDINPNEEITLDYRHPLNPYRNYDFEL